MSDSTTAAQPGSGPAREGGAVPPPGIRWEATAPRSTAGPPLLNGAFLRSYDPERAGPRLGALPRERSRRAEWRTVPEVCFQAKAGPAAGARPAAGPMPELILDDSNLLPFAFLRTGDRLGRAVVKIEREDGAAGTGFLIAPGILLTNHHVLPDIPTAAGSKVHANYEAEPPDDPAGKPMVVPLDPGRFFLTNAELDFTFCGVGGLDHLGTVPLLRDSLGVMPSEYVNIIQHPAGRPKEVALQDSRVVRVDHVVVQYCCDTEPGSSGSPVFNNQWRLVAMHHASVATDSPQGRRAIGGEPDAWYLNEGIRLSAIALWLESAEANTPELKERTARLRAIFGDLDGQVGYFGALGQRAAGRSAAELIIDAYRDRAGAYDVAFWDLEPLRGRFLLSISNLAWVLAAMHLDLWCLARVGLEDARLLREHLETFFQRDYGLAAVVEPELVVLYRKTRVASHPRVVERAGGAPCLLVEPAGPDPAAPLVVAPWTRGARPDRGRQVEALLRTVRDGGEDLLILGDGLRADDLHALVESAGLRAALGAEGGFALVPARGSRLGMVFASPNLDLALGQTGGLEIAQDRRWPRPLDSLETGRPIAVRLVLDHAGASTGVLSTPSGRASKPPARSGSVAPADTPGRLDPELEKALREILARYGSG